MAQVDLLREGGGRLDGLNTTLFRVYRVWTDEPGNVLGETNLPQVDEPHPVQAGLVVQSYGSITREPAIRACRVTVNYGVPPFAGGGGNDQPPYEPSNAIGRLSYDLTTRRLEGTVPILRAQKTQPVTAAGFDPAEPPPTSWVQAETPVLTVQSVRTVKGAFLRPPPASLAALFNADTQVEQQTGVLHVIGGRVYEYSCRVVRQSKETDPDTGLDVWEYEHSWTYDPGVVLPEALPDGWAIAATGNSVGTDTVRLPALPSTIRPGLLFVRPPYSDVVVGRLSAPNESIDDPEFIGRLAAEQDASGYEGLPGL